MTSTNMDTVWFQNKSHPERPFCHYEIWKCDTFRKCHPLCVALCCLCYSWLQWPNFSPSGNTDSESQSVVRQISSLKREMPSKPFFSGENHAKTKKLLQLTLKDFFSFWGLNFAVMGNFSIKWQQSVIFKWQPDLQCKWGNKNTIYDCQKNPPAQMYSAVSMSSSLQKAQERKNATQLIQS